MQGKAIDYRESFIVKLEYFYEINQAFWRYVIMNTGISN